MTQAKFLKKLATLFEELAIPYVVVGSVSSSIHGEPRFTRDVDIVIKLTLAQLDRLIVDLATDCYISETAAREAWRNQTMFNVIDYETGWKADLIIFKPHPYETEEFNRRVVKTYEGVKIYCLAPEDVILSKLRWAEMASSERQMKDALDVARVCWQRLDFDYLKHWASELDVTVALETVIEEAKKMLPEASDGP